MKKTGWNRAALRVAIIFLSLTALLRAAPAAAASWDMDIPIPNNDPQWEKVKSLWANHYDGKNFDELIAALTPLKEKYPDSWECALWLAEVNYMHGRRIRENREKYYAEAERLSAQVAKQDPKNTLAIRILVDTLGYSRDREYVLKNYGALIKSAQAVFAQLRILDFGTQFAQRKLARFHELSQLQFRIFRSFHQVVKGGLQDSLDSYQKVHGKSLPPYLNLT